VVLALAIARVTVEWLFIGFSKVPFTCTYQPGKANLRVSWPKYAAIGFVYCAILPALARRLLDSPREYALALAVLLALRQALVRLSSRSLASDGRLSFDDNAEPALTRLELES
jgi:hypothetical protein